MWPKGRAPLCILSTHIIVLNKEKWYTHTLKCIFLEMKIL
jgi:hypothetical protein